MDMSDKNRDKTVFGSSIKSPEKDAWEDAIRRYPYIAAVISNYPNSVADNRYTAERYLEFRKVSQDLKEQLLEPYHNGFYKKADGKSAPLSFMRVPRFLRVLGFFKDIVSVRHDFDYYRGKPSRRDADKNYREGQLAVGHSAPLAYAEFFFLRIFGYFAWSRHELKRKRISEYGEDSYIKNLPDVTNKHTSLFVWIVWIPILLFFLNYVVRYIGNLDSIYSLYQYTLVLISAALAVAGYIYIRRERQLGIINVQTIVATIASICFVVSGIITNQFL